MNKTLRATAGVTVLELSSKKSNYLIVSTFTILIMLVVGGAAIVFNNKRLSQPVKNSACALSLPSNSNIDGNTSCVVLEKANTDAMRIKGLSGRLSMSDNEGMLFVFDDNSSKCMWMKDMRFDLDMVWLNQEKKIIKIEKNISQNSYPTTFCSSSPAKYVIELNKGVSEIAKLSLGQKLYL